MTGRHRKPDIDLANNKMMKIEQVCEFNSGLVGLVKLYLARYIECYLDLRT